MMTYPMHVAGLVRDLPICKVTEDFYIGAFIMFGDAELTVACARDLLKLAEELDYDYLLTAEAKSIPLIHEMARQSGAEKYFIARKGPKVYMPDPISVEDRSITTLGVQQLFLGRDDADLIKGKKILIVDDVISTGGSLHAMETLVAKAGGTVAGRMAVLAEGDGRENRELGVLLGGEKRGLELVGVAEGLEEDEIGAGFRAQADLLGEGVVGRVEFEVAGGLEEPARRADVQGDALCAGVACALDGGGDHVLERRVAVVFRRIRAEGVGRDDVRPGFEIGAVDGGDVRGTRQVPELGNFAGLKSAFLQLGAHRTVEKSDHERIPMMAVTLFEGIMRQVSVRVMPRRRCPSTAARKSRWVSSGRSP